MGTKASVCSDKKSFEIAVVHNIMNNIVLIYVLKWLKPVDFIPNIYFTTIKMLKKLF